MTYQPRQSHSWLLGDHLGSTSMVADAGGQIISELRYSAFGETRYQNGTFTTDYLYTGQRQEAEIGLYYYVARWYDPAIGRFIQADSVVPNPASAKGFDRYSYSYNNPLALIDPSGHWPETPNDSAPCIDGNCDYQEEIFNHMSSQGQIFQLPIIEEDSLTNIQPFGATLFAHGAGKLYSYCQGFHCGIDFFADWGTPVQAGVYGTVIGINWSYEGPYNVVIQSGDYLIKFGHLTGDELPVSVGEWVFPDTTIGFVGNMSGKPNDGNIHIHVEVRSPDWSGLTHNPENIMALDVKQTYRDYLEFQTGYPGGKYYNSRKNYSGTRETPLPSEAWWQTPDTIRRVDDGSTLWK